MFYDSMREYVHAPKVIATSIFFSALSWLSYLVICYIVFLAIGISDVSLGTIFVTQSIVMAVKSIPIGVPFRSRATGNNHDNAVHSF
jgi:uncharacterized membrane protein YbhN (UPF0104 family)